MPDPITILLVEDDPDIREVATLSLETLGGFRVIPCTDGDAALRELSRCEPDLILLDWMMPGLDGGETLAAMRAQGVLGDRPVVFMTAKARRDEVERMTALGAWTVITKPFDPLALPQVVGDLVARARRGEGRAG